MALPSDWKPNEDHARIAREEGRDMGREALIFRDKAIGNGLTQLDWDATFRNWLRSDYGARPLKATGTNGKRVVDEQEYNPQPYRGLK